MTEEELLALDIAYAREVLGLEVYQYRRGREQELVTTIARSKDPVTEVMPRYSRDLGAAFPGVALLEDRGYGWELQNHHGGEKGRYWCCFWPPDPASDSVAFWADHAACALVRAALAAVRGEKGEE